MTLHERNCPTCGATISYSDKYKRQYAEEKGSVCSKCAIVKTIQNRPSRKKYFEPYERNCPKCSKILSYTDRRNFARAIRNKGLCTECAMPKRSSPAISKKISKTLTGKKYPNRKSNERKTKPLRFFRICPNCKKSKGYVRRYSIERANKQNSVCNSCSAIIYKKTWNDVITSAHREKMAAKKAGYDTFAAYMKDLDNRKKYYRDVRLVTTKQDISLLENYDKLRGLCGVNEAYQLDHIISVSKGYTDNIAPDIIGDISNLRIIPWKDNLLKSNK